MTGGRQIVALLAAVAAISTAVALGNWQLQRAQEKRALQGAWDEAQRRPPRSVAAEDVAEVGAQLPRRVKIAGHFVHEHEIWLDNRSMGGRAGFFLVTPLRLAGGAVVLVNRGFVQRDPQQRLRLPPVARPDGEVMLDGMAVAHLPRLLQLGAEVTPQGKRPVVWQNVDFEEFERISGLRVARWVLQQTGGEDDGLLRHWPPLAAGVDKHRGYAFQWFALAALIVALTLYFGYRAFSRSSADLEAKE